MLIYQQIAADLRSAITSGQHPPGTALPTIADLMRRYDVARGTVREALRVLAVEGLVTTVRGSGTIVRKPPLRMPRRQYTLALQPGSRLGPWQIACIEAGAVPRVEMIAIERKPAPTDIAETLGIAVDDEVVCRRRHMYADDDLIQIHEWWAPTTLTAGSRLEGDAVVTGGVYSEWLRIGHEPAEIDETISVRMPTPEEASLMGDASAPVMLIERVTRDGSGTTLELLRVIASDRVQVAYEGMPLKPTSRKPPADGE